MRGDGAQLNIAGSMHHIVVKSWTSWVHKESKSDESKYTIKSLSLIAHLLIIAWKSFTVDIESEDGIVTGWDSV